MGMNGEVTVNLKTLRLRLRLDLKINMKIVVNFNYCQLAVF